jgi:hypothetical protein
MVIKIKFFNEQQLKLPSMIELHLPILLSNSLNLPNKYI